jgi:hypothetical protein
VRRLEVVDDDVDALDARRAPATTTTTVRTTTRG